jgi:V/A-type H+-transporting ATPase subunit F
MEEKVDMAAIGNSDTIMLFKAIGVRTFSVNDNIEADKTVFDLANRKCKIIYVTEELYATMNETIEKYKSSPFPIIIPIPSGQGSKEIGLKKIKDNVEKAIGIDIF